MAEDDRTEEVIARVRADLVAQGVEIDEQSVARMVRELLAFDEIGLAAVEAAGEQLDRRLDAWEVLAPHVKARPQASLQDLIDGLDEAERARFDDALGDTPLLP